MLECLQKKGIEYIVQKDKEVIPLCAEAMHKKMIGERRNEDEKKDVRSYSGMYDDGGGVFVWMRRSGQQQQNRN